MTRTNVDSWGKIERRAKLRKAFSQYGEQQFWSQKGRKILYTEIQYTEIQLTNITVETYKLQIF